MHMGANMEDEINEEDIMDMRREDIYADRGESAVLN